MWRRGARTARAQSHYVKIKYRKTRHDCVWVPEDELDTGGGGRVHSLGAAAELIQFALSMSVVRWIKGRGDIVVGGPHRPSCGLHCHIAVVYWFSPGDVGRWLLGDERLFARDWSLDTKDQDGLIPAHTDIRN